MLWSIIHIQIIKLSRQTPDWRFQDHWGRVAATIQLCPCWDQGAQTCGSSTGYEVFAPGQRLCPCTLKLGPCTFRTPVWAHGETSATLGETCLLLLFWLCPNGTWRCFCWWRFQNTEQKRLLIDLCHKYEQNHVAIDIGVSWNERQVSPDKVEGTPSESR